MDDFEKNFNRALRYLSFHPRSIKEVIDYLKKKSLYSKATEEQKKETLRTQLIDMGVDPEKIKIYFEMNPTTLEVTGALAQVIAEKMKTA